MPARICLDFSSFPTASFVNPWTIGGVEFKLDGNQLVPPPLTLIKANGPPIVGGSSSIGIRCAASQKLNIVFSNPTADVEIFLRYRTVQPVPADHSRWAHVTPRMTITEAPAEWLDIGMGMTKTMHFVGHPYPINSLRIVVPFRDIVLTKICYDPCP